MKRAGYFAAIAGTAPSESSRILRPPRRLYGAARLPGLESGAPSSLAGRRPAAPFRLAVDADDAAIERPNPLTRAPSPPPPSAPASSRAPEVSSAAPSAPSALSAHPGSSATAAPGTPSAPSVPGTPLTPGAPGSPDAPAARDAPGASGASGTRGTPGTPGTPGAPVDDNPHGPARPRTASSPGPPAGETLVPSLTTVPRARLTADAVRGPDEQALHALAPPTAGVAGDHGWRDRPIHTPSAERSLPGRAGAPQVRGGNGPQARAPDDPPPRAALTSAPPRTAALGLARGPATEDRRALAPAPRRHDEQRALRERPPARIHIGSIDVTVVPPPPVAPPRPLAPAAPSTAAAGTAEPLRRGVGPWYGLLQR